MTMTSPIWATRWPKPRQQVPVINAPSSLHPAAPSPVIGHIRGLYAITPDAASVADLTASVRAALSGGAAVLQYRQRSLPVITRRKQAEQIQALCRQFQVPFIINDDVELAADIDADGVHLGRDDNSLELARRVLGENKIIGISCYNDITLASAAVSRGADYIAFGSFFPSPTKPSAVCAEVSLIAAAKQRFSVPVVAIGGITLENAPQLIALGVDAVAVISDLFGAGDIAAHARAYTTLFSDHVR